MVVDHLSANPQGGQRGAQGQQHPPPAGGDAAAQQPQQQGYRQSEQKGKDCPLRSQSVEAVNFQEQLLIVDDHQEKEGGGGQPAVCLQGRGECVFLTDHSGYLLAGG